MTLHLNKEHYVVISEPIITDEIFVPYRTNFTFTVFCFGIYSVVYTNTQKIGSKKQTNAHILCDTK